jgi:hypothetical protein
MIISDLIGFRTYQALENLYLNLKDMQSESLIKDFRKKDSLAHAKEYGTLKLTGPRRSGHTTAIKTFVKNQTMNEKETWAILTPTLHNASQYTPFFTKNDSVNPILKSTKDRFYYNNGSIVLLYGIQSFINGGRGLELNGIIVDCASFMKKKQLEEIYNIGIGAMHFKEYVSFIFIE